ncbi:MAG: hypothetical protein [Bacteriophage sp.]|nr:MAG: hypothetical protein [Bacteriophage sp.]
MLTVRTNLKKGNNITNSYDLKIGDIVYLVNCNSIKEVKILNDVKIEDYNDKCNTSILTDFEIKTVQVLDIDTKKEMTIILNDYNVNELTPFGINGVYRSLEEAKDAYKNWVIPKVRQIDSLLLKSSSIINLENT